MIVTNGVRIKEKINKNVNKIKELKNIGLYFKINENKN